MPIRGRPVCRPEVESTGEFGCERAGVAGERPSECDDHKRHSLTARECLIEEGKEVAGVLGDHDPVLGCGSGQHLPVRPAPENDLEGVHGFVTTAPERRSVRPDRGCPQE